MESARITGGPMSRAAHSVGAIVATLGALLWLAHPAAAAPAAARCWFQGGFLLLHDRLPHEVGTCTGQEQYDPVSGDAMQRSTGGVLIWRKADNWPGFTDGSTTWINGPYGLL